MTTHEAMELQPHTRVHAIWGADSHDKYPTGIASPEDNRMIRIIWDDLAEPDSVVSVMDRMLLASVAITEPVEEPGSSPAPRI